VTWNCLTFADLHGKLPQIPTKWRNGETVIFLCGDICNNYPDGWEFGIKQGPIFTPCKNDFEIHQGLWNYRRIDGKEEGRLQNEWVLTRLIPHLLKNGIDLNNVIVINGNHDWTDFDKYFTNALRLGSKTIEFRGVKIGLLTGVNSFVGEWNDEITEWSFENRIAKLDPDIQILVSHAPPHGIMDATTNNERLGSREITKAIFGKHSAEIPYFRKLKFHLFGHVHNHHGGERHEIISELNTRTVKFYNCANTRFDFEFTPSES